MKTRLIFFLSCAFCFSGLASADGRGEFVIPEGEIHADASQDDKRLPPVYPGEEVGDGKKVIKSWSTSGSVVVSPVPVAPQPQRQGLPSEIGVIIDRRSDLSDERSQR